MKISQSTLGAADKCLLSAQYTLDPPEWAHTTAGSSRLTGTGYHAGLELLYKVRMETGVDPSLDQMIEAGIKAFDDGLVLDAYSNKAVESVTWDEKVPDAETGHELIRVLLTEYVQGGHLWPATWQVLAVEFNAWFDELGDNQSKLGADLILMDPNGWIVAVDHKTANKRWDLNKHEPRKNNQAPLYVRNLRKAFPDAPGYRFVFDIMQYPNTKSGPKFERRISDPRPEHEEAIARKVRDFAFLYETVHVRAGMDLPANPASTLCNPKWCDFFAGCPYGAALENAA